MAGTRGRAASPRERRMARPRGRGARERRRRLARRRAERASDLEGVARHEAGRDHERVGARERRREVGGRVGDDVEVRERDARGRDGSDLLDHRAAHRRRRLRECLGRLRDVAHAADDREPAARAEPLEHAAANRAPGGAIVPFGARSVGAGGWGGRRHAAAERGVIRESAARQSTTAARGHLPRPEMDAWRVEHTPSRGLED